MTTPLIAASPSVPSTAPAYPKAQGYNAFIGDLWVRTAPNQQQPIRYYTKDSLAQRQDRRGSTYENVLDLGYAWARGDLSGGEGLDYDPRLISQLNDSEARDVIRFFDSSNIDIRRPVRGESFRMKLAHSFVPWTEQAPVIDITTSDAFIYVAVGDTVYWYADWEAVAPAGSQVFASTIAMITVSRSDELAVTLADGDVWIRSSDGTVTQVLQSDGVTPFSNVEATWWAKGRFISAVELPDGSGQLFEVAASGAAESPFDTYIGNCYSVVSSGPAVVAAISDGTVRSYVPEQSNQLDAGSVNLVIRGRTDVPEGEILYLLGSNAGVLLILTRSNVQGGVSTTRVYQSEVLDARFDYVVGQLQLRREWLKSSEGVSVRNNMPVTRDELWFTIEEQAGTSYVWRFDVVTLGLSRHVQLDEPLTTSTSVFDDKVGLVSEGDVFRSSDDYVGEGWLISPNITFGLNAAINWFALALRSDNLDVSGIQVELYYSTNPEAITDPNHASWVLGLRVSSPSQADAEAVLAKVQSRQLALMVKMYSTEGGADTPNVSNFAVRGLPEHRDWILELPINVSDYIEVPYRYPQFIQGYGNAMHSQLLSLVGRSVEVGVLDPPIFFRGIVDGLIEPTEYVTERGSASVRCILQLRGERITATATPTGNVGLGLGLLGVATLGIGQEG